MSDPDQLFSWWASVEEAVIQGDGAIPVPPSESPAEAAVLAEAAVAEVRLDLDRAHQLLEGVGALSDEWQRIAELLDIRLELRNGLGDQKVLIDLKERTKQLISSLPDSEMPTRARALFLLARIYVQENRSGEALEVMADTMEQIGDSPSLPWVLDTIANAYLYLGAWSEGRRTFRRSILAKDLVDDHLGIAISSGSLALAEIQSGNPGVALEVLDVTWSRRASDLEPLSRLRLATMALQAAVELDVPEQFTSRLELLNEIFSECGESTHPLIGFALLIRARTLAGQGRLEEALADLDQAAVSLRQPELQLLLAYWRVRLSPPEQRAASWREPLEKMIDSLERVSEGEILTRLLIAEESQSRGDQQGAIDQLDEAFTRAVQANQPYWLELVDRSFREADPERHASRTIERFSGRPAEEIAKTTTEDATIIFADLAGFTRRSTELSAEEVMETVRSVFELAVPLLARYQVRPLQYLGDGLLAACQGEGHRDRGLHFAIDLVKRADAASRIRRAQGEEWGLDLRAGVNSGPVVFGLLGSSFKQEWLAIGKTTNLAARLQSKGEIGEVVTLPEIAEAGSIDASRGVIEAYELKGFTDPVPVLKIPVDRR
ncbi:MAG: adenylate/guanylate cyclase domain-containing protein [Planctomycetota bacterium]|nr:adenylate/guanylate cyclase domain-containing protein [Planctomycetota bacterium]